MKKRNRNPVAKHCNTFNKPKTFVDQKKRSKKGYRKHKGENKTPLDYLYAVFVSIIQHRLQKIIFFYVIYNILKLNQ